jgi:hypothetical protein
MKKSHKKKRKKVSRRKKVTVIKFPKLKLTLRVILIIYFGFYGFAFLLSVLYALLKSGNISLFLFIDLFGTFLSFFVVYLWIPGSKKFFRKNFGIEFDPDFVKIVTLLAFILILFMWTPLLVRYY